MATTSWKSPLAILGAITGLAIPGIGQAGDPSRAEELRSAPAPRETTQDAPTLRKAQPSPPSQLKPQAATKALTTGTKLSAECAPSFVKEIKPDHPGGFYVCRLPAGPACAKGYDYVDAFANPKPTRFQYECKRWLDDNDPWACPAGWSKSGSPTKYQCASSPLNCSFDHQLDGVSRAGPTPSPLEGGTGTAVYKYVCKAR